MSEDYRASLDATIRPSFSSPTSASPRSLMSSFLNGLECPSGSHFNWRADICSLPWSTHLRSYIYLYSWSTGARPLSHRMSKERQRLRKYNMLRIAVAIVERTDERLHHLPGDVMPAEDKADLTHVLVEYKQ